MSEHFSPPASRPRRDAAELRQWAAEAEAAGRPDEAARVRRWIDQPEAWVITMLPDGEAGLPGSPTPD